MSIEAQEVSGTTETPHPGMAIADRRRAPRLRCLLTGIIVLDDGKSTMDCTVRNISAWGARIELADAFRLADGFKLIVPHHAQTHRAKIIWRKGDRVGLALSDIEEDDAPRHRMTPREAAQARRKEMLASLY